PAQVIVGRGVFPTVVFEGKPYLLDYRDRPQGNATAGMYRDPAGRVVPDASTVGAAAAAVPGTVAGLWELHRRFGKLAWSTDLAPAIHYDHGGFRVSHLLNERREE